MPAVFFSAIQSTMIAPRKLRDLDLAAASGIAALGSLLYVVADDETDLRVLARDGAPLGTIPLFAESLPEDPVARKAAKPDLEAVTLLPDSRVLVLGSGSTPARMRGAAVPPWPCADSPRLIDLAPLYQSLSRKIPELNIEGAAASQGLLRLFHRGNGAAGVSAVVDLSLDGVLDALCASRPWDQGLVREIHRVQLGSLQGIPLGFTDAAPLPGGQLIFSAAAEDSPDTYRDGPCAGSIVGLMDADLRVLWTKLIDTPTKIEGLHASLSSHGASIELLMVADADDPRQKSPLLEASILTR
ncbi:MAG: hypothetical protein HY698_12445 [Deltaproteobacteria bacterium]|nr:hypothetical protein [Deltaproteobacteria bacterium]